MIQVPEMNDRIPAGIAVLVRRFEESDEVLWFARVDGHHARRSATVLGAARHGQAAAAGLAQPFRQPITNTSGIGKNDPAAACWVEVLIGRRSTAPGFRLLAPDNLVDVLLDLSLSDRVARDALESHVGGCRHAASSVIEQ